MTQTVQSDATTRTGILNGKWLLGTVLVSGDIATVYEATHRTNGKRVSVRILHATLASSPEALARFQRDALVANRVAHPGAVQILDDDVTEEGSPFLVMERLEGDSLANVVRRAKGAVTPAEVVRIAYELLAVLAAAHASGIVHRNVRPESVFLTKDGRVKLMDFGLASVSEDMKAWDAAVDTETEEPGYVPPERAQETLTAIDAQSDIWAVGAVMFRLLSGRAVRGRGTGTRLDFGAAMRLPAPALASVAPETSPELAAIVDKALALDKAARWPDAASMQSALEKLAPRVVDRPTMRTLDFSPSKMPSLRFQIATVEPPKERRRAHLALIFLGVVVCSTVSYQLVRHVVARDAPAGGKADAARGSSTSPVVPREVDLPSETIEPASSAQPEPVPLTRPRHRRHGTSNGASPPDDPPEAPAPSASSMLDRRH